MGRRARTGAIGFALACAGCVSAAEAPAPAAARAPAPAPPASEPEEWDRELPPEVRLVAFGGEATHAPIRVVADATGEPIAGARLDNWWEPDLPHVEPWAELLDQSAATDRDGWAVLR